MFGTDGVRGVAGTELGIDLAMKLGQAGAYILSKDSGKKRPRLLVGTDTRISGDMLANALISGICSVGADAVFAGVIPTPAIAYLTHVMDFDAGVVISASHNPMEFNGIKFFSNDGYKLPDEIEDKIQDEIERGMSDITFPTGADIGRVTYDFDIKRKYIDFEEKTVPVDLTGMKIVMDCANGASYITNTTTVKEKGADLIAINVDPDGTNINRNCGSTHLEELQERVKKEHADIGIAFDGDADRMLAVDEEGRTVDGDEIMSICARFMKDNGRLNRDTLVVTVMSNIGISIMGRENGINIETTKVGDRYVLERMKEGGFNIGGEQSGHIIFLDDNTTGDGMMSALHLLDVMVKTGKKLSELRKVMNVFPQALVNANVPNDRKYYYLDDEEIRSRIDDLEKKFDGDGRVLIRPSGTEPLVRVMIEGKDQEEIERDAKELASFIEKRMNF
jgi:phosphoglucosamine mutase